MGARGAANPEKTCKMTTIGPSSFQIKAADMPAKIKLCESEKGDPATTSAFNTNVGILVYDALTNPPTLSARQPTSVTALNFTLELPAGEYDIDMVLSTLPASSVAYVYEDCSGLNQLVRIPTTIKLSGHFYLKVI
jgi:hypothetical protein